MLNLNQRALGIVQQMIQDAKALDVAVSTLDNGTVVVDAGIDVPGSLEAGLLFARVCLGGLGTVDFCQLPFGDAWLPGVTSR